MNSAAAFETARNQAKPVLILMCVEAHGDSDLDRRVEASAKKLPNGPVGLQLVYPEEAYAQPGVAREFIRWADLVGATQMPAAAWVGPDGRPYGLIELEPELTDDALDQRLAEMGDRYETCVEARERCLQLEGTARAQGLHEYLQLIDEPCRDSYQDVMAQIVALDSDNALGLKSVYQPVLTETAINTTIQEQVYPLIDAGAYAKATEVLSRLLRDQPVTDEQRQLLMAFQAQLLHSQNRTAEAIKLIDQALAIEAQTPAREKLVMARLQFMSN
ncbi:MAG: hypothetical protein AAGH99_14855 [Planctomycetota bacterium]